MMVNERVCCVYDGCRNFILGRISTQLIVQGLSLPEILSTCEADARLAADLATFVEKLKRLGLL